MTCLIDSSWLHWWRPSDCFCSTRSRSARTRSGVTFASYNEGLDSTSLKVLSSPLLDEYLVTQYETRIREAKRFGLIRKSFSFEEWAKPRFLNEVLRELELDGYWVPHGKDGKPKTEPKT